MASQTSDISRIDFFAGGAPRDWPYADEAIQPDATVEMAPLPKELCIFASDTFWEEYYLRRELLGLGKTPEIRSPSVLEKGEPAAGRVHHVWDHVHTTSRKGEGVFLGLGGLGFAIARLQSLLLAVEAIVSEFVAMPIIFAIGIIGFSLSMLFTAVISGINAYRGWRLGQKIESFIQSSDPNRYQLCLEYLKERARDPAKKARLEKLIHPGLINTILDAKAGDAQAVVEKVHADRSKRTKLALFYMVLSILGAIAMPFLLKYAAGPIFIAASAITLIVTLAWPIGEIIEVVDAYKNQEPGRGTRLAMVGSTLLLIASTCVAAVLGDTPKAHLIVLGTGLTWLATQIGGALRLKKIQPEPMKV